MSISAGDTAWMMVSAILVMFMTPGVGFFYGGMVNKKNMLSTIAYCVLVFIIASLTWALLGFSLAFGNPTAAKGFIGDCIYCGLRNISLSDSNSYTSTLPFGAFFFFQMMLAGITPAIFVGTIIGRIRISFLIFFTMAFVVIVYSPIAYWVWNKEGWLFKMGAIDFAGGVVIHLPAGVAALASANYLGPGNKVTKHNSLSVSLTLVGTAILWFGWFGFNGGAAFTSGLSSAVALINTHLAACAGGLAWAGLQYMFTDRPTILGWCCGSICGLVSITSGAGYVALWASIVIGAIGGSLAYIFCHFKSKYYDDLFDNLDVFGCHGVSSIWGSIAAGAFATLDSGNSSVGLFYGDGRQFGLNILGVVAIAAYSFAMTTILYFLLSRLIEPKVTEE